MLNVGMTELLVFGIIAILVLGPDKIPEGLRFAAKWYAKIKRMVNNVQNDIDRELRLSELKDQMHAEMKRIEELEHKMQLQMQELQQQNNFNEILSHESMRNEMVPDLSISSAFPIYVYLDPIHRKSAPAFWRTFKINSQTSVNIPVHNSAKHNDFAEVI